MNEMYIIRATCAIPFLLFLILLLCRGSQKSPPSHIIYIIIFDHLSISQMWMQLTPTPELTTRICVYEMYAYVKVGIALEGHNESPFFFFFLFFSSSSSSSVFFGWKCAYNVCISCFFLGTFYNRNVQRFFFFLLCIIYRRKSLAIAVYYTYACVKNDD